MLQFPRIDYDMLRSEVRSRRERERLEEEERKRREQDVDIVDIEGLLAPRTGDLETSAARFNLPTPIQSGAGFSERIPAYTPRAEEPTGFGSAPAPARSRADFGTMFSSFLGGNQAAQPTSPSPADIVIDEEGFGTPQSFESFAPAAAPAPSPERIGVLGSTGRQNAIAQALRADPYAMPNLSDGEGYIDMGPRSSSLPSGDLDVTEYVSRETSPGLPSVGLPPNPDQFADLRGTVPDQYLDAEAQGLVPPGTFSRRDLQDRTLGRPGIRAMHSVADQDIDFTQEAIRAAQRGDYNAANMYGKLAEQDATVAFQNARLAQAAQESQDRNATDIREAEIRARATAARGAGGASATTPAGIDPMSIAMAKEFEAVHRGVPQEILRKAVIGAFPNKDGVLSFDAKIASDNLSRLVANPADNLKLASQLEKDSIDLDAREYYRAEAKNLAPQVFNSAAAGGMDADAQAMIDAMEGRSSGAAPSIVDNLQAIGSQVPAQGEVSIDSITLDDPYQYGLVDENGLPYNKPLRVGAVVEGTDKKRRRLTAFDIDDIMRGSLDTTNWTVIE